MYVVVGVERHTHKSVVLARIDPIKITGAGAVKVLVEALNIRYEQDMFSITSLLNRTFSNNEYEMIYMKRLVDPEDVVYVVNFCDTTYASNTFDKVYTFIKNKVKHPRALRGYVHILGELLETGTVTIEGIVVNTAKTIQ